MYCEFMFYLFCLFLRQGLRQPKLISGFMCMVVWMIRILIGSYVWVVGFQLAFEGLGDVTLLERCVVEGRLRGFRRIQASPHPHVCLSPSFLWIRVWTLKLSVFPPHALVPLSQTLTLWNHRPIQTLGL